MDLWKTEQSRFEQFQKKLGLEKFSKKFSLVDNQKKITNRVNFGKTDCRYSEKT